MKESLCLPSLLVIWKSANKTLLCQHIFLNIRSVNISPTLKRPTGTEYGFSRLVYATFFFPGYCGSPVNKSQHFGDTGLVELIKSNNFQQRYNHICNITGLPEFFRIHSHRKSMDYAF